MDLRKIQEHLADHNIKVTDIVENNKASEAYIKTIFTQDDGFQWQTYVPYIDRRAGLELKFSRSILTTFSMSLTIRRSPPTGVK